MKVTRLDIHQLRRFEAVSIDPGQGLNVLVGDNGAGKTSVLEALHLLAYGRSFRGRVRDGLIRRSAVALEVFATYDAGEPPRGRRIGLRHAGATWNGRLDGEDVDQLGALCQAIAVVTFEPGSHALVTGSAEERRRYVDWGVFHVEHNSLPVWRRYNRALKQRNALLKAGRAGADLDAWDRELADAADPVDRMRATYVEQLSPYVAQTVAELAPALGIVHLQHAPGWRHEQMPLADALLLARDRDRASGFTSVGPHRADMRLMFDTFPGRDALSRGQTKLLALSLLLAQAQQQADARGEWPVVSLDDLASELDATHQALVVQRLRQASAQVFITGTALPLPLIAQAAMMFHVEHGNIRAGGP